MKRRNPRRRNLSRNKKIGIALGTVAAVAGVTALVVTMRRRKPEITDGGGEGTGGPAGVNQLNRAKRRLCLNPNELTLEQRILLQEQIFIPLIAASANPNAIGTPQSVAAQALDQLNCLPRPDVVAVVNQIAQQSWETYIGFAG